MRAHPLVLSFKDIEGDVFHVIFQILKNIFPHNSWFRFFFLFFFTYSELNHKAYWRFGEREIEGIFEILLVRLEDMKTQMN